jgi:hypothetical protein
MSDSHPSLVALLRAELAAEVAAGFPRLKRIPNTDIIWFLDYFDGLAAAERTAHLDALARSGARHFFWRPGAPRPEIDPPLARYREAKDGPGGKGGTRYMDVKMLCMDKSLREPGYYHESWRQNFTPLHFQPRADLLPDLSHLKAAKAPLLRKLVNAVLTDRLRLKKEKQPGGAFKYVGSHGDGELTVWVDLGSRLGQLRYEVTLKNAAHRLPTFRLAYESLWDAYLGWDYLTEENAERCVDFFPEQVVYLANLAERVNGLAGPQGG